MKSILKYALCLLIFFNGYYLCAQVGINTENPQTMLDVNGNLALNAGSLSLSSGDNNIVADTHSLFNIDGPTADFNINTIQPLTDVDGQLLTLVNTTSHTMTLVHNDGAGANSIFCTSEGDLVLKGIYTTVTLQYIKTLERWMAIKYTDGGIYTKRIFNSVGLTDTNTNSFTFVNMANMSVPLTSKNSTVYVNVSLSGHMGLLGSKNKPAQGYGDFRLVKIVGGITTEVVGFTTLATDFDYKTPSVTAWNSRLVMFPVSVTPGEPTTFRVQWRRAGQNPGTLYCSTESFRNNSHRSITIFD